MIARGAIHNPKIFEEFKNSFDELDCNEDKELEEKEFGEESELDNDIDEIKDDKDLNKGNKSLDSSNNDNGNKENNNKKQKKKNKKENDDVKTSQNLARILDLKYQGRRFDINPIIKDYLVLVIF